MQWFRDLVYNEEIYGTGISNQKDIGIGASRRVRAEENQQEDIMNKKTMELKYKNDYGAGI